MRCDWTEFGAADFSGAHGNTQKHRDENLDRGKDDYFLNAYLIFFNHLRKQVANLKEALRTLVFC